MRKITLALFAAMLCHFGFAQDGVNRPQLEYGPKIGSGINQFDAPGSTIGVNAGLFVRYGLADIIAVQGELLYDLQGGGRHDYSSAGPIAQVSYQNRQIMNHALSIPISAKIMPLAADNGVPYILIGASPDILLGNFEKRDLYFSSNDAIILNDKENIDDDIALFQASGHFGIGMDFLQSDGRAMGVELRYRRSFMNINEGQDDFADPLRPRYGFLFSSTLSVNFYASISLF